MKVNKMPPVAILAGGVGKRLRSLTQAVPKPLIEIHGRPFVEYQLELLREKGIPSVILCVGYMGEKIKERIGRGDKFGLSIRYSFDGERLLGTGGALRKALPLLGDIFLVIYGDSYLDTDYKAVYDYFCSNSKGNIALMTVFRNENRWDRSNVLYERGCIVAYDKKNNTPQMKYIDYGLSILKKEALEGIGRQEVIDLADIYCDLIRRKKMLGYEVRERFYEIGSAEGLRETGKYLAGVEKK